MTSINDEMLMAYADGELSREECRRLEALLAVDAGLRARLEPFAMTGQPLAHVFDQPMREPIPERLLAVVTAGGRQRSGSFQRSVRPELQGGGFLETIAEAIFPHGGLKFAGAFALASLFAAGGAAGYLVAQMGAQPGSGALIAARDGALVAAGSLETALETQPSLDEQTAASSGAALWPAASFQSREASFCREYKIAQGEKRFGGVACRSSDAQWRIAVHAELKSPAASGLRSADGTATEHWSAGHEESAAVDAAVETLKHGDVLEPKDEAAAIARGWAPPPVN